MKRGDAGPKQLKLKKPALPDESTARTIAIGTGDWGIEPDATDFRNVPQWVSGVKSVALPDSSFSKPHHNHHGSFLIANARGIAAMSRTNTFGKHSEVNLADQSKRVQFQLPYPDGRVVAISPSGTTILTLKAGHAGKKGRMDFWATNFDNADSARQTQRPG